MKWPASTVAGISSMVGGGTPSKRNAHFWNGHIPWVSPKDMGSDEIHDTQDHITQEAVNASATKLVPEGATIVVVRSGILAHRFPVSICRRPMALNQDLKALIPRAGVVPEYLAYLLRSKEQTVLTECVKRGATVHSVDTQKLKGLAVSLPPPSEQRRIVEILDQADELWKKRAEADKIADRIVPALFYKMFGDPATNPMGWEVRAIGDITALVTSGLTPRGGAKNYLTTGPYFLRSQNVRMNSLDLSDIACLPPGIHESMSRTHVKYGDVLLNITGASIGRVAWYDRNDEPANVNQHVCILRLTAKATPQFVSFFLSTPHGQQAILRAQTGATRQGLNHENVRGIPILCPPLPIQEAFAVQYDTVKESSRRRHDGATKLDSLSSVLLHRAFTGDLTAKWREAHMKELLQEMEQQSRELKLKEATV